MLLQIQGSLQLGNDAMQSAVLTPVPGFRLRSWLAPLGPGRPVLQRYRQGGLDCLASARARGQEASRAWEPGVLTSGLGVFPGRRIGEAMPSVRHYY